MIPANRGTSFHDLCVVVGGDCGGGNHHGTDYSDGHHCWHGVMVVADGVILVVML